MKTMKYPVSVILSMLLASSVIITILVVSYFSIDVKAQAMQPHKVLIVVTSHGILGNTNIPTGLWLPEMTHPYYALKNAGLDIMVASPKGGNTPIDPYSIPSNPSGTNRDDPLTQKFLSTQSDVEKINNTMPLSDIDPKGFSVVVFPGGNGATYDFPSDRNVNRIAVAIYEQGGIVAAVCHGPAALLNATLSNGTHLIKGAKVTGFSNEEEAITEILIGKKNVLPFFLENELPKRGATYEKTYVHEPLVVVSGEGGRLITGQNPESATNVGEKIVEVLNHDLP